jgi:hypothetical protein
LPARGRQMLEKQPGAIRTCCAAPVKAGAALHVGIAGLAFRGTRDGATKPLQSSALRVVRAALRASLRPNRYKFAHSHGAFTRYGCCWATTPRPPSANLCIQRPFCAEAVAQTRRPGRELASSDNGLPLMAGRASGGRGKKCALYGVKLPTPPPGQVSRLSRDAPRRRERVGCRPSNEHDCTLVITFLQSEWSVRQPPRNGGDRHVARW